jgi:hypothetical protein
VNELYFERDLVKFRITLGMRKHIISRGWWESDRANLSNSDIRNNSWK